MEQFFNTFYDGYNNTKEPNYKIIKLNNEKFFKQKNRILTEDSFISNPIKNEIKKFNNCYKIECLSKLQKDFYPYNSNKYMPCIEIYYFTKNKEIQNKQIKAILLRLFFISNLYSKLSQDSTPVKCWICPTHLKKLMPKNSNNRNKNKILGPNEVNSGLCIPSYREIILWRNEELNKVLIHELIHTFNLDEKLYETNNLKNYIYKTLNISRKTKINPNEAYTESLAIILNTIFNMVDENNNSMSTKDLYKKYTNQINTEIDFSINQASKILLYNGYTNINELFKSNNSNNKYINKKYQDIQWKQNTNVLSYYILKIAILNNSKKFINYLKDTNNLYINNSHNFIKILNKSLDNKAFINKINNRIKKIEKIKNYKNNNLNNSNITLRMSSN